MPDAPVATASSNTTKDSVVTIQIEDLLCSLEILQNSFGDKLPVIPAQSRAANNKVLYQLKIKAKLVQRADGKAVIGHSLALSSSRIGDVVKASGNTAENGELIFTLETREAGSLKLKTTTRGVTLPEFSIELKEAWYESKFLITGYNVCSESDFSGDLVEGKGLNEKHKKDFLYSAAGIPMQGTGKGTIGGYIRLKSMEGGWHKNAKGHPDYVNTETSVSFSYADSVKGAFGEVTENHSIAVDPHVIPKNAKVNIESVGDRFANDRGSAIDNYHIDNFLGAGKAVVTTWLKGGVNGTERLVKYLGDS